MPSAERRPSTERQPDQPKRVEEKEAPAATAPEQRRTIKEVFPFAVAEIANNIFVVKGAENAMVDTMDPSMAETRPSAETQVDGLRSDYDAHLESLLTARGEEGGRAELIRLVAERQKDLYIATAIKRKNPAEALSLILADIAEQSDAELLEDAGVPNLLIIEGEQALASIARDTAETKQEAAGEYASILARAEVIRAQRQIIDTSLGRKTDPTIQAATAEGFVEMLPSEMYAQGSEAIQAQIDRVNADLMQITALGDLADPMDAGRAKLLTAERKRHEAALDVLELFDDAQTAFESIKQKVETIKDEWIANWEAQLDGIDLQIGSVSQRLENAESMKTTLEGFIEHFEGTPEAEEEQETLNLLNNLIPELQSNLTRLENLKTMIDNQELELDYDADQAIEAANTQLYSELTGLAMDGNGDVVADLIEERLENKNLSSAEREILEAALTWIDGNPWEAHERTGAAAEMSIGDKVSLALDGGAYLDGTFEVTGFTATELVIVKDSNTGKEYRYSAETLKKIPDAQDLPPVPPVAAPPEGIRTSKPLPRERGPMTEEDLPGPTELSPPTKEVPPPPVVPEPRNRILADGISDNASREDAAALTQALESRTTTPSELERLTAKEHGMEVEDLRRIQTLFESMQVLLEAIGRPAELEELPKDWDEFLKAEKKSERGFFARLRGKEAEQDKMMSVIMEKYQLHKEEMLNIDPNADYIQFNAQDLARAVSNLEQVGTRIKVTLPGAL